MGQLGLGIDQTAKALRKAIGCVNCLEGTAVALFLTPSSSQESGRSRRVPPSNSSCSFSLTQPLIGGGGQQLSPFPTYSRSEVGKQPSVSAGAHIGHSTVPTKAAALPLFFLFLARKQIIFLSALMWFEIGRGSWKEGRNFCQTWQNCSLQKKVPININPVDPQMQSAWSFFPYGQNVTGTVPKWSGLKPYRRFKVAEILALPTTSLFSRRATVARYFLKNWVTVSQRSTRPGKNRLGSDMSLGDPHIVSLAFCAAALLQLDVCFRILWPFPGIFLITCHRSLAHVRA